MDKEMLLQRLQSQYLTRQEVLYKLPLNISINAFWPELLNRRKMNGTILPLHRGDGKPYWYVLTDKMIAASEKLCALALDCCGNMDPYRTNLTPAMTEEMFYTSFVEGAQVSIQEAMQFLERGTEPENVQEQLIQNNRSAWSDMTRMLFYPLDERFVRLLALRLTDEMEGQASDYRQTDSHVIAAMGGESYMVPSASEIPGLMQEYYNFLSNTEVHPLIKAAVGQAYLLVTRPFPDGNERLSRMISYAVLLRSGYDFFRDISISGAIAQENYLYYKCMQDIIRSENEGDLTYFIEYYLDLLARAVDAAKEKETKRQQDELQKERQAATQPLEKIEIKPEKIEAQPESSEQTDFFREEAVEQKSAGEEVDQTESPPKRRFSQQEYEDFLIKLKEKKYPNQQRVRMNRICDTLLKISCEGRKTFTRSEWEKSTCVRTSAAKVDCRVMKIMGLVDCTCGVTASGIMRYYHLPVDETVINKAMGVDKVKKDPHYGKATKKQRDILLKLMSAFPGEKFTIRNAAELMGIKSCTMEYHLDNLERRGLVEVDRTMSNVNLYSFSNEVHAIFAAAGTQDGQTKFEQLPAMEKQIHNPVQDENEAC